MKNNLAPTQTSWDLIDPYSPPAIQSVEAANKRIESYIKTHKKSYRYRGNLYYAIDNLILAKENLIQYLKLEQ